jgi:dihydrofolate synthase / folylpolyglutamate synthase
VQFIPVKTRAFLPPKDNIYNLFDKHLPSLREGDVLIITSKILGIHQGRTVKIKDEGLAEKDKLALKEVTRYIPRNQAPHEYSMLTINQNILISAAGIDKSNANGYYILWPKNTQKLLKEIWKYLTKKNRIKKLGVIAVDSYSTPLRSGTLGVSIGFYGIKPVSDQRGQKDIFGRKLKVTKVNIVDSLATFGNLIMGEADERTPLLIMRGTKLVEFTDRNLYKSLIVDPDLDMFQPLLKHMKTKKK